MEVHVIPEQLTVVPLSVLQLTAPALTLPPAVLTGFPCVLMIPQVNAPVPALMG
jgi:hypothetical protein